MRKQGDGAAGSILSERPTLQRAFSALAGAVGLARNQRSTYFRASVEAWLDLWRLAGQEIQWFFHHDGQVEGRGARVAAGRA